MTDWSRTARREPDDPCNRATPHIPHRNWRSDRCGVCPGVPAPIRRR